MLAFYSFMKKICKYLLDHKFYYVFIGTYHENKEKINKYTFLNGKTYKISVTLVVCESFSLKKYLHGCGIGS
jgi:hypothetical protein